MKPYLDPIWSDQRQEIIFLKYHPMNEVRIRVELGDCLFEALCSTPGKWRDLIDPFPSWNRSAA